MDVRRFIKGIDNEINRDLSCDREHIFEALSERVVAGLLRAIMVCRVQAGKNVQAS